MSTRSISRHNRELILNELAFAEPMARAQLAEKTGLSVATVSRAVGVLAQAGLVCQDKTEYTMGRPSVLVEFSHTAAGMLVVDVADHHTEIAHISLSGAARPRAETRTLPDAHKNTLGHTRRGSGMERPKAVACSTT